MFSLLKIISFLLGHMPLGLVHILGRVFGRLIYKYDKKRRKITLDNIDRAYRDELTQEKKQEIAQKVFVNLAKMFFEFTRIPWLNQKSFIKLVKVHGTENLAKALEKKKGVILCTGHFGNWELFGASFGHIGFKLDVVARELDSPVLEQFVKWVRTRSGNVIISKNRAMRKLMRRLADNGIVTILLDQNVALAEGVFVDFFSVPACTNKGPALLAATTGAAVVPAFIIRHGSGYRLEIQKELELTFTGDRERDALENTARCTKAIEDIVRKHPEQWFWVHRRWKTRPPQTGQPI
ncbi:MAG: lysophospholipid acyltransferase family protein [Deltaproteobacteria bacterium]|nr:lysophospholipid acyltransferase family protein [Deltaproteobacteria bacterium]